MSDLLPVASDGREDTAQRIRPPVGVTTKEWAQMIECGASLFRKSYGQGTISKQLMMAEDQNEVVRDRTWDLVFDYPHNLEILMAALSVRGAMPLGKGLTVEEQLVLDIVTNPADHTRLSTKLRKANVTEAQFATMMQHKPFAEQLALRAERNLNAAAPLVTMNLTQLAVHKENLAAIQYFDKRAQRDPDKTEQLDSHFVVETIIDILTSHLSKDHPDLLRSMAAELEVRLKLNGYVDNPASINQASGK